MLGITLLNHRKSIRLIILLILSGLLAVLLSPIAGSRADVGIPPVSPAGSSVDPGAERTNVRMLAEWVDLTIEPYERTVPEGDIDSPAYHMRALVEAEFKMRNLGDANDQRSSEAFDAWFPLAATTRVPEMMLYDIERFPEKVIQDFKVWVDGTPTAWEQVLGHSLGMPSEQSPWATFPVTFPPGQDVTIHVNYTVYPGGNYPFGDFEYILETGAGWNDTIGDATIRIYLPDTVTPESVSLSGNSLFGEELAPHPAGYTIENNVITWHFTDLEPSADDNIFVNVLDPMRYRALLAARGEVQNNPESADAQLGLARAAHDALSILHGVQNNGGGQALGEQATQAYIRALELAPDRPDLYAEYARWLMLTGAGRELFSYGTCQPALCDLVKEGLAKFPDDPELKQIDEEIRLLMENYLTVTQIVPETPTLPASPTATPVLLAATATPKPSPSPVPVEPSPMPTQNDEGPVAAQTAGSTASTSGADTDSGTSSGLWLAVLIALVLLAALVVLAFLRKRAVSRKQA